MKCVALISGGKDSWFNIMQCVANGHEIVALANLRPLPAHPDELDSFMYQTVGHDVIHLQAECFGVPLYHEYITGQSIEQALNYATTANDETEDLYRILAHVKTVHPSIQGVSVGAILSNYQRTRVENVCARLGLTSLGYLWQRDQKELLAEMIAAGLTAVVIKVAAIGLKSIHLGKTLAELQPMLLSLVGPSRTSSFLRIKNLISTFAEKAGNMRHSLLTALFGPSRLDSIETVDHSSGDVAYLRISAHTEEKERGAESPGLHPPPLLEDEFRRIHEMSMMVSQSSSVTKMDSDHIEDRVRGCPRLVEIGAGVYCTDNISVSSPTSAGLDIRNCLDQLICATFLNRLTSALLTEKNLTSQHIICIILLLKDMSDFMVTNPIYASYFTAPLPPSRVTISTDIPDNIQLAAVISTRPRTGLHVQSRSFWAPANIGPYSQAISYDDSTCLAGQIGLIPATMELPSPCSTVSEAALSLQHIFRVARAVKVDPQHEIEGAVAYIVAGEDVSVIAETWKHAFEHAPPLAIVLVNGLPRGARVEWHVLRCQKSSQEVARSALKVVFEDDQLLRAITERKGDYGVLATIFGSSSSISSIKSQFRDLAVQAIPARAVYSASQGRADHKNFCAFIMSD